MLALDRFGIPSIGGDVKAHLCRSQGIVVLISNVQGTDRRVGAGRNGVDRHGASTQVIGGFRCSRSDDGFGIEAISFSAKEREPSFYLGF